jgi:hypothetical protein
MQCLTQRQAVDYLTGETSASDSERFEAHLEGCPVCGRRLAEIAEIRAGLVAEPGEFEDPALKDAVMTLIDLGRGDRERLPKMRWTRPFIKWIPVAAAAAAVPLLVFQINRNAEGAGAGDDITGFTSRGADPSEDQWVSVELFERHEDKGEVIYRPVVERLPRDAALALAYEDRSETPFPYLMVFAVDEKGSAVWYYPETMGSNDDARSISTAGRRGRVTLPEEVTRPLFPGPLRFFGIFSKTPLTTEQVRTEVKRRLRAVGSLDHLTRLEIDGTGQWTRQVTITPQGK